MSQTRYSCPHCTRELTEEQMIRGVCPTCHKVFEVDFKNNIDVIPSYKEQIAKDDLIDEQKKKSCYVCCLPFSLPPNSVQGLKIECSRCHVVNVITESGKTNRPERLAIYHKYDGDVYDKKLKGLFQQARERVDVYFSELRIQKTQGLIDEKEYKKRYGKLYRKWQKELSELEKQKREELKPIWEEEARIRENLK